MRSPLAHILCFGAVVAAVAGALPVAGVLLVGAFGLEYLVSGSGPPAA